jgi:hypothetical protein
MFASVTFKCVEIVSAGDVESNSMQILEDNVKFRSRLLDDDDDPMKLRPAQSVLHFQCHDVNVNIDGALWAYR